MFIIKTLVFRIICLFSKSDESVEFLSAVSVDTYCLFLPWTRTVFTCAVCHGSYIQRTIVSAFSGIGLTFRGIIHGDIRKVVLDMEDMSWSQFSSYRDELCVCVDNDGGSSVVF